MAEVPAIGQAAREGTTTNADVKGKLVEFAWTLKKEGIKESSIETYLYYLEKLIKHSANLLDPDSVKGVIANERWDIATKALICGAYSKFLEVIGSSWKRPKYKKDRTLPYIPLERELDALISGARKKTATFLQLLKETGMRSGEAWRLKWINIDLERRIVTLNNPEKHGVARTFTISPTLTSMLSTLPKQDDYVFKGLLKIFRRTFRKYRNRMATKLQNPRLKAITFHTFRHWKATTEYHKTKDILHVMQMLGHRDIKTTLIYTQLIQFETEDYYSAVAKTVEEARSLIETGFEYVTDIDGVKLFRKRK